MTKKIVLLLLVLAFASTAYSQLDGPIAISGSMDCTKPEKPGVVTIKNTSQQMVMAYVLAVTNLCFPRQELYRHDFFFKANGFGAGESDQWKLASPGSELKEMTAPLGPPNFEGKVLFVQLADGTTWGDADVGQKLFSQRADVLKFLNRLRDASGDEKKFLQILRGKHPSQTSVSAVAEHIRMMQGQGGTQAAIDNVNQRLRIAEDRGSLLH